VSASANGTDLLAETEDQRALRQLAREVAQREIAPRAAHGDESGEPPLAAAKALAAADLLRVTVGEEWGGFGYGDLEASIVLEEIARADVSSAIWCQLTFNGPPRGIEHLGTEALKDRWLPAVANGEALISIGITEPDAGSAVQEMRTHLVADPASGGWRLNGYKNYSTLGHVADGMLVWCRWPTADGQRSTGARGIGAVVLDMDRPGVTVTGVHRSMGVHAATEAEVAFDDVAISPSDVLIAGDPESTSAFKVLLAHLNHERCGNAAMCLGAAQGALELATRHLHDRVIGGEPLANRQGLQWKLADMAIALDSARLLLRRAVQLAGDGGTPPPMETAMAKAGANRAAKQVCDEAIQLLGGYGYSREHPLERAYRDVRGLCIGAGTIEAQLNYIGANVARGRTTNAPGWIEQQLG
jgi:alkylation response protein AidB-like acyl-CoA dehydrogenase